MYFNKTTKKAVVISAAIFFGFISVSCAQAKKYPSLLWEITGNGLHKPSYLFGTMHVSSKLAFHLSDSFYIAIKNVDEVALEQNPLYWQRDMMKMEGDQLKINSYMRNGANNYLTEKSFQLQKYEDNIRVALTDEPQIVNSLLYRNYQTQEDYEENTYLDLYIYQTGRKLGKKAAGVEDYYQTERLVFEAYQDAAKEKNKRERNSGDESVYEIEKKIQAAYRQGDLDALDSLQKYEYTSPAFLEKFLYKRNEIQAHSIDTIVKQNSLFVGVGAAHLAGKRGVIELLRKMGYHLRPVQMQDRNADRKDEIDKLKVPVRFRPAQTDDGFVTMQLPGFLYKRTAVGYNNSNESWQYADMENGTYYTVIRVKTHAELLGQTMKDIERKTDSLLYENIPGKILKKAIIRTGNYPVFDISNRTRRGDLQRYNIIITPFEEIICKMSGNEDYVSGEEANTFFNSIKVGYQPQEAVSFESNAAGFKAMFPQQPYYSINNTNNDRILRYEWESVDTTTGNAYAVWKKTVNNFRFLEEDTFDLSLIEESIKRSDIVQKEISRTLTTEDGFHALLMKFALKNGKFLSAKALLRGAHYYVASAVYDKPHEAQSVAFLRSFQLTDFVYTETQKYQDTALHFTVKTPVIPVLDSFLLRMVKETAESRFGFGGLGGSAYNNDYKAAFFQHDASGEAVLVTCTTYPKYFYRKDSAEFWSDEISPRDYKGFIVKKKEPYRIDDSCSGYKLILRDTNTVRQITMLFLLRNNRLYQLTCLSDTVKGESPFLQTFLSSFKPDSVAGESVFTDKQNLFFADYQSKDSATHAFAENAAPNVRFSCRAVPQLQKVISSFAFGEKNYFENKTKFIHELGFINDSDCVSTSEKILSDLYRKAADTTYFQNEILLSLARLKTKNAYDSLQAFLLQDPPVFDDDDDYAGLFEILYDSLDLTKRMFPNLLQLSAIESYKMPVNGLLRTLVDSGFVKAGDYNDYFSRIYFDAKIEVKKMQNNDEHLLQKENNDEDDIAVEPNYRFFYRNQTVASSDLSTYSALLIPFWDAKPSVPLFFQKQLSSKNPATQMDAAIIMTKNKKPVADSVWENIARQDKYRVSLLKQLEDIKRKDLFPKDVSTQEAIAKSVLLNDKNEDKFQSLQLISKQLVTTKEGKGYVYFFKYKLDKDDDWKIGISGLQPADKSEISTNDIVTKMTNKTITDNKPEAVQLQEQLKELLFSLHESAYRFFGERSYYDYVLPPSGQ